ncbi:MAG: DUF4870 domain-containing protein [Pyrinomonadaceae bacterium]|nr:DUF4870 domain-containing protein [Pyrinomonadaceae bacterium]
MQNMSGGKSALGLDGNVTALIGYLIGIVALILIFIEKDNKFVRFHAIQAVLWSVFCTIGIIVVAIVGIILGLVVSAVSTNLAGIVWILTILLYVGLIFGLLGGLIFGAIKAYGNSLFKLPVVGNFAEKWSS